MFADDLITLASSIIDLQEKINTLKRFCQKKGLKVNLNKTKIIKFKKSGRPKIERS